MVPELICEGIFKPTNRVKAFHDKYVAKPMILFLGIFFIWFGLDFTGEDLDLFGVIFFFISGITLLALFYFVWKNGEPIKIALIKKEEIELGSYWRKSGKQKVKVVLMEDIERVANSGKYGVTIFKKNGTKLEIAGLLNAEQFAQKARFEIDSREASLRASMTPAEWAQYKLQLETNKKMDELIKKQNAPRTGFGVFKSLDD